MSEEQEVYEVDPIMSEAPASLNLRFASQHGFECQLTVRCFDAEKGGLTLLGKLKAIEESLHKKGCKPIFGKNSQPTQQPQAPEPELQEEHPSEKACPVHNVMMKKRTGKDSQVWYSHKLADGSWCNGKE